MGRFGRRLGVVKGSESPLGWGSGVVGLVEGFDAGFSSPWWSSGSVSEEEAEVVTSVSEAGVGGPSSMV